MAEIINDRKIFSLLEVAQSIQRTLADRYTKSFWVKAEMNKLNHYSHSGHCYPELVEKRDGKVIAQIKANLWKSDFERINKSFLTILKEPIKDGIKILFCATINFDPSHGLSLRIIDIDPSFALGELEREKQDTIARLIKEGVYGNNKKLSLAVLPKRIAVISVETSKGYSDYLNVIEQNPWGYKFFNFLFPSLLQGERSIPSIINQLSRIRKVAKHFDAVAIIRGGGGDVGLSSFNNYELAKEVALFPLPVFTGIGHSTNETVIEMVSYKNAITPTDLADFLIQKFHNFSMPVKRAEEIIVERSKRMLKEEKLKFRNTIKFFQSVTTNRLLKNQSDIQTISNIVKQETRFILKHQSQYLDMATQVLKKKSLLICRDNNESISALKEELLKKLSSFIQDQKKMVETTDRNVRMLDPINILKRGFTITLHNGKAVTNITNLRVGDRISTVVADGEIISDITDLKNPSDHE